MGRFWEAGPGAGRGRFTINFGNNAKIGPGFRLEKNLEELRYGKTIVIINTYLIVVDFLKHLTDIRASTCHASA